MATSTSDGLYLGPHDCLVSKFYVVRLIKLLLFVLDEFCAAGPCTLFVVTLTEFTIAIGTECVKLILWGKHQSMVASTSNLCNSTGFKCFDTLGLFLGLAISMAELTLVVLASRRAPCVNVAIWIKANWVVLTARYIHNRYPSKWVQLLWYVVMHSSHLHEGTILQ